MGRRSSEKCSKNIFSEDERTWTENPNQGEATGVLSRRLGDGEKGMEKGGVGNEGSEVEGCK